MKFYSKPVEEHAEVPLADDGRWEAIVAHWTRREAPQRPAEASGNACYVLSVHRHGQPGDPSAQLAEITSLVQTQGDRVVGTEVHELHRPDPRTLIRSGVAERIGKHARQLSADLLVVDAELSPSQTRNLEDATGLPVADREAVRASRRTLPVALPLQLAMPGPPEGRPAPVISCEAVTAVAGKRTLFSALSLALGRDRLAVCGPNGSGKTTVLEIALCLRRPVSGRARCDSSRVGYIAQNAGNWRVEESLVELLAMELSAASPETIAQVLGAHRFPLALAGRPLATLSPGERMRAALICLTRRAPLPELLVLDEPTQHLDFVGLAALEAVRAAWAGGLLVVSHDAEFLDAIGVTRKLEI